ncbi:hypothetical protein [Streptomyces sp. NPDC016845]|uniref:hypothetical protein n=1 Tax=Streptomyces sp. NPDC016845 TaxID=3364972 RepID=UPI00379A1A90
MKRGMKLTAVATMVVLALTGFSTGRGHGGSHSGGSGGGGGCSSSSQDHDSSSGSSSSSGSGGSSGYDDDDDDDSSYGDDSSGSTSSSGGSGYTRRPGYRSTPSSSAAGDGDPRYAKARLVRCATPQKPYATVEVINENSRTATYTVHVTFRDEQGFEVDDAMARVKVGGDDKATVKVLVDVGEGLVSQVDRCEVDPEAWT